MRNMNYEVDDTTMNTHPETDIAQTLGMDTSSGKRRYLRRLLCWGLLVLAAAVAMSFLFTRNEAETLQFNTQPASRGDITIKVNATGDLEPTNQVDVGSELSGIIETVEVDHNDKVKVNQVLASLDTDKLEAQVLQSKAALESARAQVLQAQATLKQTGIELQRLKKAYELSGGKVPSQYDLDAAEAALARAQADEASARAQVAKAQATLRAEETDLAKTVIRSPINGIVLSRNVEPGQTVAASLQAPVLFTLAEDLTQMELHVDVDEADVGRVKEGQEALFTVDAYPEETFPARITQVRYSSQNTEGVVTYETVLEVDNSRLLLRPGMTATAEITVQKVTNGILVHNAALRFTPPARNDDKKKKRPESGTVMGKLMPRPPRPQRNSTNDRPNTAGATTNKRVWTLNQGHLVSIPVKTGATDGIMTEILEGDIVPGMDLVVAVASERR
jgi:HlyD family secretion protein